MFPFSLGLGFHGFDHDVAVESDQKLVGLVKALAVYPGFWKSNVVASALLLDSTGGLAGHFIRHEEKL